jgi:hypothetical protein
VARKPASCKTAEGGASSTETPTLRALCSQASGCDPCRPPSFGITEINSKSEEHQQLTSVASLVPFTTPTMTFGEVGEEIKQEIETYDCQAHSVGEFDETRVLQRERLVAEFNWLLGSTTSPMFSVDVDEELRNVPQNKAILDQFQYYRAGYEVTIRLNTNQFFYGAIMVTLYPTDRIGTTIYERAVLQPTLISASSAQAVVKKLDYPFHFAWNQVRKIDAQHNSRVYLVVDIACPLTQAKPLDDTVKVGIWARFTDVKLAYPTDNTVESFRKAKERNGEVQSSGRRSVPMVRSKPKSTTMHPIDPASSKIVTTRSLDHETIPEVVQNVKSLANFVADNWNVIATAAAFLLDKPEITKEVTRVINDPCYDMYATDTPDTSVPLSMYVDRYVDPSPSRMPGKPMTVSEYARIPGTVIGNSGPMWTTFTGPTDFWQGIFPCPELSPIQSRSTPVGYTKLAHCKWRGSIKVALYFWTSAFITTRFKVEMLSGTDAMTFPTNYDSGITKIVDVKGDTKCVLTLPWLNPDWWTPLGAAIYFRVTPIISIVGLDPAEQPYVYMNVFVAGGDDIQFAMPKPIDPAYWNAPASFSKVRSVKGEVQSSVHEDFSQTFPPIVPNCVYDIDRAYCTFENVGLVTDVCKRYSEAPSYPVSHVSTNQFDAPDSDAIRASLSQTLFGQWRKAFLYRSGGLRVRWFPARSTTTRKSLVLSNWDPFFGSITDYQVGEDGVARVTVPQIGNFPFVPIDFPNHDPVIDIGEVPTAATPLYVAARDDIQLGYPVLPGWHPHIATLEEF